MLIHLIAAARPNFMKIAPLYHELKKETWADPQIVHTGQHYDVNMSDAFFQDLELPEPHIHLGVGSGSHAEQTGKVMIEYEKIIIKQEPDLLVVVGDVNSTIACTLAAAKISNKKYGNSMGRPIIAHLEAGLRSFDRTMPEEINRIVTDSLADILWTPSIDGDENLKNEGVAPEKIDRIGNIMIDSLERMRPGIEKKDTYSQFDLLQGEYAVVTFHRPGNVDDPDKLSKLCKKLINIAQTIPMIFPVHPRTRKNLSNYGLLNQLENNNSIKLAEPLSYLDFMNLVFNCRLAITDSGGIQEETTYLGIPCLTMRPNTERPITITQGTNKLCELDQLEELAIDTIQHKRNSYLPPEFWDGRTAARAVNTIRKIRQ